MQMREVLEAAEKVTPIGKHNGVELVSVTDQRVKMQADILQGNVDSGTRMMNPDGSLARSNTKYAGVDILRLYQNRYRRITTKDGQTKYEVVVDHRACNEQASGQVYLKSIPAYVIVKDGRKMKVENTVLISDEVFIKEFTRKLDVESMGEIAGLIASYGSDLALDKLDF